MKVYIRKIRSMFLFSLILAANLCGDSLGILDTNNVPSLAIGKEQAITIKSQAPPEATVDNSARVESLEEQIETAGSTIEYLNTVVGTFGIIYTVLSILLGVLTIALPIITYLLAIKPSQKIMKEFEINVDKRLENYLRNARDKQIADAFEDIRTGKPEPVSRALSYLVFIQREGFSDEQFFRIYSLLKDETIAYSTESQLANVLSVHQNSYANTYFNDESVLKKQDLKIYALIYYSKTGFSQHYKGISHILSDENQVDQFLELLYDLHQYSTGDIVKLFNDETIIDMFLKKSLLSFRSEAETTFDLLDLDEAIFKDTYLYNRIDEETKTAKKI